MQQPLNLLMLRKLARSSPYLQVGSCFQQSSSESLKEVNWAQFVGCQEERDPQILLDMQLGSGLYHISNLPALPNFFTKILEGTKTSFKIVVKEKQ